MFRRAPDSVHASQSSPVAEHTTTSPSAPLSINPTLLHGNGVNAVTFPGSGLGDNGSIFRASDSELAELESLLRPQAQQQQQRQHLPHQQHQHPPNQRPHPHPHHSFDASCDAAHVHHHHQHHHQRLGSDSSLAAFSQPVRAVPRHLEPMTFSPLSPNEMYSPESASTSAGLLGTDFFPSDDFGSFTDGMTSPSMTHEFSSGGQDRTGRSTSASGGGGGGGGGSVSASGSSGGKVLSSRSRSGRRVSGSYGRPDASSTTQHPMVIPHPGSPGFGGGGGGGGSSSGTGWTSASVPSRPQAMSVPTYLPHRPLDLSSWGGGGSGGSGGGGGGDASSSAGGSGIPIGFSSGHSPFTQAPFYSSVSMSQPSRLSEMSMGLGKLGSGGSGTSGGGEQGVSSAPAVSEMGKVVADFNPDLKQSAALLEKRKKRRESHNLVERKRRDNINDRITELATLLPEFMLETPPRGSGNANGEDGAEGSEGDVPGQAMSPQAAVQATRPNKGVVLSKSVEYIRLLIQRNEELEHLLRQRAGGVDLSGGTSTMTTHFGHHAQLDRLATTGGSGATSGSSNIAASLAAHHNVSSSSHLGLLGSSMETGSGSGSPMVHAKLEEVDAMEV